MENHVYIVFIGFYDWVGDWVEEIDLVFLNESLAMERVEELTKDNNNIISSYYRDVIIST